MRLAHPARFAALAAAVTAAMAATAAAVAQLNVWQAESFGDRRLPVPRPDECALAARVTADFVSSRNATLRRAAGAPDAGATVDGRKLELLAFAWRSPGNRTAQGVDWRDCPGLGRFVRRLGLQHMGSGGMGPALYVSRPLTPPAPGQPTQLWATYFAPQRTNPVETGRDWTGSTTWQVTLPTSASADALPKWLKTPAPGSSPTAPAAAAAGEGDRSPRPASRRP